jgi:hypothetical protein
MVNEWRIPEIVNQTLLFFALHVRHKVAGVQQPTIKPPLPPFRGGAIQQQIDGILDEVARNTHDLESLRRRLDAKLSRLTGWKANVDHLPRWKVGDVVEWWIAASVELARWRASRMRRDVDAEQVLTAERRAAVYSMQDWLWNATVRRLQLEDDEEYPPIWCESHVEAWKLGEHQLANDRPKSWDREACGPDDCRLALLEWCGDTGRELGAAANTPNPPTADAWAADYEARYRDFARSSLRLLRRRCQFAPQHVPNSDRTYQWRLAYTARSPSVLKILRRPLLITGAVENRLPGWFVSPWPAATIEQYRKAVASIDPRPGSIDRALAAAANALRPEDRSFAPLPPWGLAAAAGEGIDPLADGVERLAAVVRLAVTKEAMPRGASPDGQPAAAGVEQGGPLRDALAVEGFRLRRTAGDAAAGRRIPLGEGSVSSRGGAASRIILSRADSEPTVDVGVIGPPARCPEELLAAIEELDWRWWAIAAARGACDPKGVARQLADLATAAEWEKAKCRLLDLDLKSPEAARELAAAFTTLDTKMAIGLSGFAVVEESGALRSLLADRITNVTTIVLQQLLSIDPVEQGGLYPPRTAAGRIDLAACATDRCRSDARAREWRINWKQSSERFGAQSGESWRDGDRFRMMISAGESATDSDLRSLDDMLIVSSIGSPWDVLWRPLRTRVMTGLSQGQPPDFDAAIGEMRQSWNGEAANAFNELVTMAVAGQPRAVATLRLLHGDSRFGFACHPAIDVCEQKVSLRPVKVGDALVWRDDQAVPVDRDVEIFYAFDPARARRVVSRGQPAPASPEASAARFAAAVPPGSSAKAAVEALRNAIDCRRMFDAAAADPLSALVTAANALALTAQSEAWVAAAFSELSNCCKACECRIVPADWDAVTGVPAEGLDIKRSGFHGTVPMGRAVVERFGVNAVNGTVVASPEVYKSAGPEPTGYREVAEKVNELADNTGVVAKFRQNVHGVPERVEKGHSPNTFIRDLFACAWDVKLSAPDLASIDSAVQAVHQFLERSYGMVLFMPKTIGEFPKNWLERRDGGQPRGNRVELVVRPGVKTRDNNLVCPAIVETE